MHGITFASLYYFALIFPGVSIYDDVHHVPEFPKFNFKFFIVKVHVPAAIFPGGPARVYWGNC